VVDNVKQTCANCRFWWNPADPEVVDGLGECRARSPQVVAVHDDITHDQFDGAHVITYRVRQFWPDTAPTDWCGEHEPAARMSDASSPPSRNETLGGRR
jgi:hypothetical protein